MESTLFCTLHQYSVGSNRIVSSFEQQPTVRPSKCPVRCHKIKTIRQWNTALPSSSILELEVPEAGHPYIIPARYEVTLVRQIQPAKPRAMGTLRDAHAYRVALTFPRVPRVCLFAVHRQTVTTKRIPLHGLDEYSDTF